MSKFDELKAKLADKPGVTDPAALAATIGRRKLGDKAFAERAAAGRRKKASKHRTDLVREYLKKHK
jgi:hypothetical protein